MSDLFVCVLLCTVSAAFAFSNQSRGDEESAVAGAFHNIAVTRADGTESTLQQYAGKLLLIVNVASKCGFTPQYEGLETLYKEFKDQGLVILGFPSNDFLGQEPGSNEEIQQFCRLNYGVSFPVFAKVSVKGKGIHPLYAYLTDKSTNPMHGGRITWNFNKFLVGPDGSVLARFGSRVKPESGDVVKAIKKHLPGHPQRVPDETP